MLKRHDAIGYHRRRGSQEFADTDAFTMRLEIQHSAWYPICVRKSAPCFYPLGSGA